MGLIQPKPFLDKFKLRHHAVGTERRRNLSKIILEKNTPFPLPISYSDIDASFFDWVDKTLDIAYDGKKLPTYKLFSNQKISEYSQTWQNLDDTGNIIMNFKTITRENNPQHGENQGGNYNIPGHRDYPMFIVPVLQENGEEAYDLYTMKQPFAVNFTYTVNLITNKYELLNEFNEMINYEFQSLECYISPNGHAMPMFLDAINDESEYTIDDRKFYSQSYQIKVMGYIIRKEDYKVERIPSRFIMRFIDDTDSIKQSKVKRNHIKDLPKSFSGFTKEIDVKCNIGVNGPTSIKKEHSTVVLKEEELSDNCCIKKDDNHYYNKKLEYEINIPDCESALTFTIDNDMVLDEVETNNVYDFVLYINKEFTDLDWDVKFYKGDEVEIKITRDDLFKPSSLTLVGYDPNVVIDRNLNPESALDEIPDEEKIIVDNDSEEFNGSGETASDD
jgi:hypothetical protein